MKYTIKSLNDQQINAKNYGFKELFNEILQRINKNK